MKLTPLRLTSFDGGINRSLSDFEIKDNEVVVAENCFLDQAKIVKRKGYTKLTEELASGADVISIYEFYKESTATSHLLVQAGTSVYEIDKSTGEIVSTPIDGALTEGYPLTYATINSTVYMSNGKDPVYKWNNTGAATQVNGGDFPKAKYIIVHKDKLFLVNIATASASYPVNENMVYFSQAGAPETIDSDAHFIVYTTDGDVLSGVASLFGYLILFKNHSTHRLQGTSKGELILDSNLVCAYPSVGCVSHKSIVHVPGGIAFLSDEGVQVFDSSQMIKISEKVDDFTANISRSYRHKSSAFWDGKHYRLSYATGDSTTPNETLVGNIRTNCWTVFTYGMNDYFVGRDGNIYGAGDGGFVHKIDSGLSDAGEAIDMKVTTKVFDFGAPHLMKVFRKASIDAFNTNATLEFMTVVDRGEASFLEVLELATGTTFWGVNNWAVDSGTVSITSGTPIVTRSAEGANWLSVVEVGDSFQVDGDPKVYTVQSVDSDTQITLTENYTGDDVVDGTYCIWNDDTLMWEEPTPSSSRFSYPKTVKGRSVYFQFRERGIGSELEVFGLQIRIRTKEGER